MGIEEKGQVVLMIHCGSRGFGHQVQTEEDIFFLRMRMSCYFYLD